ncbi:hypothetical protein FQN60_011887 [Etheostoma spectabile]|uniref:Uncharacterized protein n=1 Tax=Etheostoma spectabile TaxID=54343 RepID=A0A5J5DNE4_9PERO|nr:hypothetical protein FQN60_011887 [Etheostoma spectabile]
MLQQYCHHQYGWSGVGAVSLYRALSPFPLQMSSCFVPLWAPGGPAKTTPHACLRVALERDY